MVSFPVLRDKGGAPLWRLEKKRLEEWQRYSAIAELLIMQNTAVKAGRDKGTLTGCQQRSQGIKSPLVGLVKMMTKSKKRFAV